MQCIEDRTLRCSSCFAFKDYVGDDVYVCLSCPSAQDEEEETSSETDEEEPQSVFPLSWRTDKENE